jgi:CheY-like chemotaxis protein
MELPIELNNKFESQTFDLLIIDDQETWRELFVQTFEGIYSCDVADNYEAAIEKLRNNNYEIVCTNYGIEKKNPSSLSKGRKLLCFLKTHYPDLPVVLISGIYAGSPRRIQDRYPNIKEVLFKGLEREDGLYFGEDLLNDLEDAISKLIQGVKKERYIMQEEYINFELYVGSDGSVQVHSDEGERSTRISLDVASDVDLTVKLLEKRQTDEDLLKTFGKRLYETLFPDQIHTHFVQTEAVARNQERKIRIRLTIESDALARLPWEFIYRKEGGYYLSVNPGTVLSRYLNLPLPPNRIRQREGALHTLIIIANPNDQTSLDPDRWEQIVTKALSKPFEEGKITFKIVKQATRREISDALLEKKPDIGILSHLYHRMLDKNRKILFSPAS